MAHCKQALKRARQADRARIVNKSKLSKVKSAMKVLMATVQAGDSTKAKAMLSGVCATIDKAAQTHVIHKNQAARKKSQVTRAVGAMK